MTDWIDAPSGFQYRRTEQGQLTGRVRLEDGRWSEWTPREITLADVTTVAKLLDQQTKEEK